jgi:TolA-binding protein
LRPLRPLRALALALLALAPCVAPAARTADDQLAFADGIYLRRLYEDAVHEYIVFSRDFPADPRLDRVFYRLGECYRHMGNENAAERFYARLSKDFPASPTVAKAALRRAELALSGNRPADAEALLRPLLDAPPPDPADADAARYYLGRALRALSRTRDAESALAPLLDATPPSPYASHAALELASLHEADASKAARARVARWFALAAETASTPSSRAAALFKWGHWAYRQGDWQTAVDTFQQLRTEFPDTPRARAARLEAAWCLFHLDRHPEALELADAAYQQAADSKTAAAALHLRAKVLRALGRDGDAASDFRNLVRLYPDTPSVPFAAYELMSTHFQKGEWELALASIPPSPDPSQAPEILWMRAESEAALSRTDLARGHYQELADTFPSSPRAPQALLRLAEAARDEGRLDEAATRFRALADAYPSSPVAADALRASALALLRLDRPDDAIADWDRLISLLTEGNLPADPAALDEARFQRALAAFHAGRPAPEILDGLDAVAASASPSAPRAPALYWRGAVLSSSDQFPEAEQAFRACLAAGPDPKTDSLARTGLVLALQQQNRPDEAADQALRLLADPETVAAHPDLVDWLVHRRLDQERFDDAVAAARALSAHAPTPAWRQIAFYELGAALEASGAPAEDASAAYRSSAAATDAATREGALARLRLAALELAAGHATDAAALYDEAASTAPDDSIDLRARSYYGLGEAAEASGLKSDAARHYMTVAVLFDDPELTPRALSRAAALYGDLGKTAEKLAAETDLRTRYPRSSFTLSLPPSD